MRRRARVDANQSSIVEALRQRDPKNPNFKNAGWHTCETCKATFHNYNKKSRFCSQRCCGLSPEVIERARMAAKVPKKTKPPVMCAHCGNKEIFSKWSKHCGDVVCKAATRKVRRKWAKVPEPNRVCIQCNGPYHSYIKTRRYCSYACHLASGGAYRAGNASAMAKLKYGAKKDANHVEVFEALRKKCQVFDLSGVGCGVPDGIAWIENAWQFFDVKNPKTGYGKRGLNKNQQRWVENWNGGPVYLIYTQEEAERFASGNFDGIKVVKSAGEATGL